MGRPHSGIGSWAVLTALAFCALVQPSWGGTSTDHAELLDQAERLRTKDHPQFVQILSQIRIDSARLTTAERWHLRYLDAWESMFEGAYAKSEAQFGEIIRNSGDNALTAKASALLLSNFALNRRYNEAFALANRLTTTLPTVTDPLARSTVLTNLSQMMNFAGQTDLAIKYADMAEFARAPDESVCPAAWLKAAALYNGKRLKSSSPELARAVDACSSARDGVTTNSALLLTVSLFLDEGQPLKAAALLDRLDPSIHINHYFPHEESARVQRAQAYEKLGNDDDAKKAALAALAINNVDAMNDWVRDAYEILYRVEKRRGNTAAALSYYEHFVALDKGYLNDLGIRSMAYEASQQQQKVQSLTTESLSTQNRILRLQQSLDASTVAKGRLYIILLLVIVASIGMLLFRVKRSQLRFKRMSSVDGLTGILNHQHFMSEAERLLHLQEKKLGSACLIFIDLDHFKQVNDTHGHAVGDIVLQHTVAVIQEHLRTNDVFGRLGGEEFGILLSGCSSVQAVATAQRLRTAIEASPLAEDGRAIALSVSVGVASSDRCGYALARLCREADSALYRAKRAGRNRVVADFESDTLTAA